MRVRRPDWHHQSHGPYLVTAFQWQTGAWDSTSQHTIYGALQCAIVRMDESRDLAIVVLDGTGEFIFGRCAKDSPPDEVFYVGTRQMYDAALEMMTDIDGEAATLRMFQAIAEWMGVQLT